MRTGIGSQSIPVGTAIGANVQTVSRIFTTPVVCDSGQNISVILRIPVGTATASQVIAGNITLDGYFD